MNISFSFDNKESLALPPVYYFNYFNGGALLGDLCRLKIKSHKTIDEKNYVLGEPFLRAWYTILDYQNMQIGFALHEESWAYVDIPFPTYAIVLTVIFYVVLAIALVANFWSYRR